MGRPAVPAYVFMHWNYCLKSANFRAASFVLLHAGLASEVSLGPLRQRTHRTSCRDMLPSRGARRLSLQCSRPRSVTGSAPVAAARVVLPPPPHRPVHTATLAPKLRQPPKKSRQLQQHRSDLVRQPVEGVTPTRTFHSTPPSGPAAAYDHQVATGLISNDDHQRSIVSILQRMHDQLERYQPPPIGPLPPPVKPSAWTRLMRSRLFADMADELHQANTAVIPLPPPPPDLPKGLYLYGSVGCGKSFLMDLFYANLPRKYKEPGGPGNTTSFGSKRVHFHQFMMDVHKKGHKIKMEGGVAQDWIVIAAREIAEETRVLCFDEFQVSREDARSSPGRAACDSHAPVTYCKLLS